MIERHPSGGISSACRMCEVELKVFFQLTIRSL